MVAFLSQKHKNIGIFGLGKTGLSSFESLNKVANVICYDQINSSRESFAKIHGSTPLVKLSDPKWQTLDKILLSPGVPLSHSIVEMAKSFNIPITSDIDLMFEESLLADFIAITGTNGKSTTTALIGHILQFCGFNYPIGGNIGTPSLSMQLDCVGYVLELSSFQLDLLNSFKAKIAVLLNITKDHLDRHKDMATYIASKCKIFDRMDKDSCAVINIDDRITADVFNTLAKKNKINLLPISAKTILNSGVSIVNDVLYDNIFEPIALHLPHNKSLQGLHNQENIAASYASCRITGCSPKKILVAIESFVGLPHRMQYVGTVKEVNFYNDSKATNGIAASKSIASLDNVYWLAGGIAKNGGMEEIKPCFSKINKAYLFGQDKELIALLLKGKVNFQICRDLTEAFDLACRDAIKDISGNKNILLAPACASFDQFKNFEERGDLFISLFNNLSDHSFHSSIRS